MTKRIIEVAERAARLWLENRLLVVRDPDGGEHRVPIGEIECVLLGTPAVSVTGALLAALAEAGVMVVISGADRLPVGMQLPLASHYLQNERFRESRRRHRCRCANGCGRVWSLRRFVRRRGCCGSCAEKMAD